MKILFLCVANSARSQLAEGLAKRYLSADIEVASAGSRPSGSVNSFAIDVLNEIGIDISRQRSKSWESLPKDFFDHLDYVITLCAEEICPIIPSRAKRLNWGMPDPAAIGDIDEERQVAFRLARDQILAKLKATFR